MPSDLSLFGDDSDPTVSQARAPQVAAISDWQVDRLRKALDARGLVSMADRRAAVEQHVGRSVESLRALTETEALLALTLLAPPPATTSAVASSWDDREEDTWIDRL